MSKRKQDIPRVDKRQWCVTSTSPGEIEMFTDMAAQYGITVPELLRRGAWLLFTVEMQSYPEEVRP